MEQQNEETQTEFKVWRNKRRHWVLALSLIWLVISVLKTTNCFQIVAPKVGEKSTIEFFDLIIYFSWIIGPPTYFLNEYANWFPEKHKNNPDHLRDLNHIQELATKVWGALVVFLSLVLSYKYGISFG